MAERNRLGSGGKVDDPEGVLTFALAAIGIGAAFVLMGLRMRKINPKDRRYGWRLLSTSFWREHPTLSMIAGSFSILIGLLAFALYVLWRLGVVGPGT
ncbi:MAG TPA: hypothetical protein DGG94_01490 [Micromonosporaceae bacterium]|nr:hypothetical protein [Micromonosporaceae bacterium]HCU48501.1 hypothetical protein [Micromonosporaceae bacterium]